MHTSCANRGKSIPKTWEWRNYIDTNAPDHSTPTIVTADCSPGRSSNDDGNSCSNNNNNNNARNCRCPHATITSTSFRGGGGRAAASTTAARNHSIHDDDSLRDVSTSMRSDTPSIPHFWQFSLPVSITPYSHIGLSVRYHPFRLEHNLRHDAAQFRL